MTDSAKQDPAASAEPTDTEPADAERADAGQATAKAPDAEGDGAKPDIDEVKRKFREALDRKREVHAEGSGKGGQDTGKIHGAHGPVGGRRSFRRKSG